MKIGRRNILVVDDSRTFLMYISLLIERMGFNVISSREGVEAMRFISVFGPDAVFLDVILPNIDGIKILEYIKDNEKTSGIPVIMISVDSQRETIEKCRRLGCADYITKPVKITNLHSTLHNVTRSRRRHIRVEFNQKVKVSYNGITLNGFAETLSEGGIYIEIVAPLFVGSDVRIDFPLSGKHMSLNGTIIYGKNSDSVKMPGIGVEFKGISRDDSDTLKNYVKELLARDIIEAQSEPYLTMD